MHNNYSYFANDLTPAEREIVADQLSQKHAPLNMFMRSKDQLEQIITWSLIELGFYEALAPFVLKEGQTLKVTPIISRYRNELDVTVYCILDGPAGSKVTSTMFESDMKFYKIEERLKSLAEIMAKWFAGIYSQCVFMFSMSGTNGGYIKTTHTAGKPVYNCELWD